MRSVSELAQVLGDRVLVKKLGQPEKKGKFFVPSNYRDKKNRAEIWWGEVEAFGLDSKSKEGYDLKVGDIVGVDTLGDDCLTFETENGDRHGWVADEFIAVKDDGSVKELYAGAV